MNFLANPIFKWLFFKWLLTKKWLKKKSFFWSTTILGGGRRNTFSNQLILVLISYTSLLNWEDRPAFGELNQARLGHFTLAYSSKPQAADGQHVLLTIKTCFGVAVEKFFDKESERIVLIPLNEVFHVSQDEAGNNLILQSTNKTCSHYECAFLGGKCLCSVCVCLGREEGVS